MGRKPTRNRIAERADYDEDFDEDRVVDEDEESSDEDSEEEEEVEEAPKPKKPTRARRTRATKTPRMKVVWGVFDNSNKRVDTFEFSQRAEADARAVELHEKKGEIYFVQPVKENME